MTTDDPKTPDAPNGTNGGASADAGESAEQTIARLSRELQERTVEAERHRDLYLRERAELENYRKRVQRDHAESLRYATAALARDLTEIVDDLERAVGHAAAGGDGDSLVAGVRLVLRNALDVLGKHGITRIDATGERFDPSRHEALATVPDPHREPNQVVEQFLPGYALHDRVVRPAKVSVSTKPAVESPPDDD